jgi:hypothetical protein
MSFYRRAAGKSPILMPRPMVSAYSQTPRGDTISFGAGDPSESDYTQHDHYHRRNLNSVNKRGFYLDRNVVPLGAQELIFIFLGESKND